MRHHQPKTRLGGSCVHDEHMIAGRGAFKAFVHVTKFIPSKGRVLEMLLLRNGGGGASCGLPSSRHCDMSSSKQKVRSIG